MSSLALSEKSLKEKWLRNYQEEIFLNKEKREVERMKKLVEEKDHLEKIRLEMEEENKKNVLKKQNLMYDNQQEINKHMDKKRLEHEKTLNEKISDPANLSLPLNHEKRIESYKNMINQLNDKIDKNINNYKQFTSNISNNNINFSNTPNLYENRNNANNTNSQSKENNGIDSNTNSGNSYERVNSSSEILHINREKQFYGNFDNKNYNPLTYEENLDICNKNPYSYGHNNYKNNRYNQNYGGNKGGLDNIFYRDANAYRNVVRDFSNFNKELMDNKYKYKSYNYDQRKNIDEERLRDLERIKKLEKEEMFFKKEQQKIYREILDGQVKAKPLGGLINPYIQNNYNNSDYIEKVHVHEGNLNEIINDIKKEENNPNVSSTPNKYFNNDYEKKFNIGSTHLNHNPILNPVPDFRYNKYLYRNINNGSYNDVNLSNSLKLTGNYVIF